jgi:3-phosphoshikimate 1-carboxyvinyltransferase
MYKIKPLSSINKEITVPADKSISHRAVILASLCEGQTLIKPFLKSEDTLATLECMKKLGAAVELTNESLVIKGVGMQLKPKTTKRPVKLFAAESGTTMRILSGLLCCQKFPVEFEAATLLENRPMERVVLPLQKMGAKIKGTIRENLTGGPEKIFPPLFIEPVDKIKGGNFNLPIASAQVKSAIMLAGLYADSQTSITEPYKSRDHTERMLKLFGLNIEIKDKTIICQPAKELTSPKKLFIPADFSSAAFFIVLGLILKNSALIIKDGNINPTRCGLLNVLKRMGAEVKIENRKEAHEPSADIIVKSSKLKATIVEPQEIPLMIDEVPILCVAASFAEGKTEIKGIGELRVKETDRVWSIMVNLNKAGVDIHDETDASCYKIIINGGGDYRHSDFKSFADHRTAMSLIIFAQALEKESYLDDVTCINKSFPEFISLIETLSA